MSDSTRHQRIKVFQEARFALFLLLTSYICFALNIFGLFGLLNKEHQMIFWHKKSYKNCSHIPKTLKNQTASGNPIPDSTS